MRVCVWKSEREGAGMRVCVRQCLCVCVAFVRERERGKEGEWDVCVVHYPLSCIESWENQYSAPEIQNVQMKTNFLCFNIFNQSL